ncbi:uroporphyrinogen-III synthase [Plebeiibacterium sediminum]|uniref:Uroporphyrinogen-III synthase n=1 Tax=Plebeiibacterium sediminum TaxID=2992112 RepID=A0AAE3M1F7_9BACT|nr:uroporphyrinogen-III synthase [Plebeiobacterium sediminum]MCW3785359.1 uroporphyrinogen-III synthase [Plebeiobacterium sediminum]
MDSILKGKVFISTRPLGKSKDIQVLFEKEGADLIEFPMIELTESDEDLLLQGSLNQIMNFTHVIFTSANAFRFFYSLISKQENSDEILNHLKVASIGYKTSEEIKSKGLNIVFDGHAKTGKEFITKLKPFLKDKQANILWPTGDLSPNNLVDTLNTVANITRINIYKNTAPANFNPEVLQKINKGNYDMIVLASPSAINNLVPITSNHLKVACIGQVTAEATLKHNITPLAIAEEPNAIGIVNSIKNYYKKL